MRILIFSDVPPFVVGGAEFQSWRLALAWIQMGHKVEIAGHRIPSLEKNGIRLIHLPVFYQGGRALRALSYFSSLTLFLLKGRKNYDFIYCRFLGEAALSVVMLKKIGLIGVPMLAVPAAAGNIDKADLALLRSLPGSKLIIDLINQQCDCVNYIASGIERSMSSIGLRPKLVSYIPNGVSIPKETAKGPQETVSEVLFVGRIVYQKGVDILFYALKLIRERDHWLKLTLIGDGSERAKLERLAANLKISDCVNFIGEQSVALICEEMLKAHIFVLPSRYEGMSNAALEAMSYGLPCILTACGGLDGYLSRDTGWVCEPEDINGLYLALLDAHQLSMNKWRSMSNKCRTLVEKNFALPIVARKNVELFEEMR